MRGYEVPRQQNTAVQVTFSEFAAVYTLFDLMDLNRDTATLVASRCCLLGHWSSACRCFALPAAHHPAHNSALVQNPQHLYVPRNSKSAHKLMPNTWAGILSLSSG